MLALFTETRYCTTPSLTEIQNSGGFSLLGIQPRFSLYSDQNFRPSESRYSSCHLFRNGLCLHFQLGIPILCQTETFELSRLLLPLAAG
jgi:hypothetical protein